MKTAALLLLLISLPKHADLDYTGEPVTCWADSHFGGCCEFVTAYEQRPYYYWFTGDWYPTRTVLNPPQLSKVGRVYWANEGDELTAQWSETLDRWVIIGVKHKEKKCPTP